MLWVYGHYKCFTEVYRRQILTSNVDRHTVSNNLRFYEANLLYVHVLFIINESENTLYHVKKISVSLSGQQHKIEILINR